MFGMEHDKEEKILIHEMRQLVEALNNIFIKPSSSVLKIKTLKGVFRMDLTVLLTDPPGTAVYQEFNAAGSAVPPLGTVQYASDNEAVATVDPNSGQLAYIGVGSCNIAAGDSGVPDGLPASAVLTVNPAVADNTPVSSTLTLNPGAAPTPATAKAAVKPAITPGKKV